MISAKHSIVYGMLDILHKLKAAGVTGEILYWFKHYLSDREQRVILPGAVSAWVLLEPEFLRDLYGG